MQMRRYTMHVLYLCTYCVKYTKERGRRFLISVAAIVNQPLMRFKLAVYIFPWNNENCRYPPESWKSVPSIYESESRTAIARHSR